MEIGDFTKEKIYSLWESQKMKGKKKESLLKAIMAKNGERNGLAYSQGPMNPNRLNPKRATPRHITIKLSEVKGKEF